VKRRGKEETYGFEEGETERVVQAWFEQRVKRRWPIMCLWRLEFIFRHPHEHLFPVLLRQHMIHIPASKGRNAREYLYSNASALEQSWLEPCLHVLS
jgi:hypothetical protein